MGNSQGLHYITVYCEAITTANTATTQLRVLHYNEYTNGLCIHCYNFNTTIYVPEMSMDNLKDGFFSASLPAVHCLFSKISDKIQESNESRVMAKWCKK